MFTLAVIAQNGTFIFQGEIGFKYMESETDRIIIKSATVERIFKGEAHLVKVISNSITTAFNDNQTTVSVTMPDLKCLSTKYL